MYTLMLWAKLLPQYEVQIKIKKRYYLLESRFIVHWVGAGFTGDFRIVRASVLFLNSTQISKSE
jgi:hypothetical protein